MSSSSADTRHSPRNGERGVALLITVFFLALATILVFEFAHTAQVDQRISRSFAEGIQDDFLLKSAVNVGRLVLEAPKLPGINEDWLGDPWAQIAGLQSFDVPELRGKIRVVVVDENSKIDLNAIAAKVPGQADSAGNIFWRDSLTRLFEQLGFEREQFDRRSNRTPGDTAFAAADQVAVLHDWLDLDANSYTADGFAGQGAEGQLGKKFFANRPLRSVSELLLVPGFTLERVQRIAPFVRVAEPDPAANASQVNVNTTPPEILAALGFPATVAQDLAAQRLSKPITAQTLQQAVQVSGNNQLGSYTTVRSNNYSIIARVESSSRVKWANAFVVVSGSGISRKATQRRIELY